ncbi:MAG: ribose 5-phosphate isomerase B [Spirochaetota bacterium]|nr:MAG: ribose 5-phosphate isomerase B [Spirochaetota bacterium]
MKIAISNDHAGVSMKNTLKTFLEAQGIEVTNLGTDSEESTDYPDYAKKTALLVQDRKVDFGIVICGTGIGASITANKIKGIRAALCYNVFTAKMARNHNNANVLALGARTTSEDDALAILSTFLREDALGDRHERRVNKIKEIEKQNFK